MRRFMMLSSQRPMGRSIAPSAVSGAFDSTAKYIFTMSPATMERYIRDAARRVFAVSISPLVSQSRRLTGRKT